MVESGTSVLAPGPLPSFTGAMVELGASALAPGPQQNNNSRGPRLSWGFRPSLLGPYNLGDYG